MNSVTFQPQAAIPCSNPLGWVYSIVSTRTALFGYASSMPFVAPSTHSLHTVCAYFILDRIGRQVPRSISWLGGACCSDIQARCLGSPFLCWKRWHRVGGRLGSHRIINFLSPPLARIPLVVYSQQLTRHHQIAVILLQRQLPNSSSVCPTCSLSIPATVYIDPRHCPAFSPTTETAGEVPGGSQLVSGSANHHTTTLTHPQTRTEGTTQ